MNSTPIGSFRAKNYFSTFFSGKWRFQAHCALYLELKWWFFEHEDWIWSWFLIAVGGLSFCELYGGQVWEKIKETELRGIIILNDLILKKKRCFHYHGPAKNLIQDKTFYIYFISVSVSVVYWTVPCFQSNIVHLEWCSSLFFCIFFMTDLSVGQPNSSWFIAFHFIQVTYFNRMLVTWVYLDYLHPEYTWWSKTTVQNPSWKEAARKRNCNPVRLIESKPNRGYIEAKK